MKKWFIFFVCFMLFAMQGVFLVYAEDDNPSEEKKKQGGIMESLDMLTKVFKDQAPSEPGEGEPGEEDTGKGGPDEEGEVNGEPRGMTLQPEGEWPEGGGGGGDTGGAGVDEETGDVVEGGGTKISEEYDEATGETTITTQYPDGTSKTEVLNDDGILVSTAVRDVENNVVESYAHTEEGGIEYITTDPETGISTEDVTYPDGNREWGQKGQDESVLNKAVQTKDGRLIEYNPGISDDVFEGADPVSSWHGRSTKTGEAETTSTGYTQEGEVGTAGSGVLVRTKFSVRNGEAMTTSGGTGSTEYVASESEVRALGRESDYRVKPIGKPVNGTGTGNSPEEALHNALSGAASTVQTKIYGNALDNQRETRGTGDSEGAESFETKMDTSSSVAFSDYKVVSTTQDEDGNFHVTVQATPGLVQRKTGQ